MGRCVLTILRFNHQIELEGITDSFELPPDVRYDITPHIIALSDNTRGAQFRDITIGGFYIVIQGMICITS